MHVGLEDLSALPPEWITQLKVRSPPYAPLASPTERLLIEPSPISLSAVSRPLN